jgi:hypothetical protein
VWTCTWMSFTSHTFTRLPLVHTPNPDFLRWRLWLCFSLIRESPHSGNLRAPRLPNSIPNRFPNSADSQFHGFAGSWLRVFTSSQLRSLAGSRFQIFASSRLRSFAGLRFQIFASSRLRSFKIPDLRRFEIPENSFHEFHTTRRFEGDRFSWIMHFAPSTCMILTMSSSRPRWRFSVHKVRCFTLQSPGVFLRSTSVLTTIGSDFVKLMNTNKTS